MNAKPTLKQKREFIEAAVQYAYDTIAPEYNTLGERIVCEEVGKALWLVRDYVGANDAKREEITTVPSMGEVVNKAAKHLPKGYRVLIEVEHEGYNVMLEYPNCKKVSVDGGDGIISDVNEAICMARGFVR